VDIFNYVKDKMGFKRWTYSISCRIQGEQGLDNVTYSFQCKIKVGAGHIQQDIQGGAWKKYA